MIRNEGAAVKMGETIHTWYLLGIQLMLELKKNGSTLYLLNTHQACSMQVGEKGAYLAPSICRTGPDILCIKWARTRIPFSR